ncbi:hypothetical protein [Nocardia camponoti]|uniref:Secreted protein n=1 Tax=Nocardia camponoti TaxID=1616106 RepID=A0A917VAI4_9NOCA|nr:hypothetical protein [Nocardia camponoti]GGK55409.1 hypothetical protein GCM10011591_29210 [Nocardia camponoti]
MNATTKFAGFAIGLAAVFGVAIGVGKLVGPVDDTKPAGHGDHTAAKTTDLPGGLLSTDRGYSIAIAQPDVPASAQSTVAFRILDANGKPVTAYTPNHEKDLHLIVVRRDMVGFQHVHPVLDQATGTWSAPLNLSRSGDYRVFADFVPAGGTGLTLGADLRVSGVYDVQPLPPPVPTAKVGDYTVTLNGNVAPGIGSPVTLNVSRNGAPVTDLQPYLGAYGHLVALRASDLAYLHVHPEGSPADGKTPAGPKVKFIVNAPSPGDYRLFLDFKHGDVVRTAEFTVSVPATGATSPVPAPASEGGHGDHGGGH